jgi:hypothetical protein
MQPTIHQPEITLSQRRGKIARLPRAVREQLNVRLDDGLEAAEILPWLNDLPEVRRIIANRFDGVPVSAQNLSGWRQGGFQEWLLHRELLDSASQTRENVEELNEVADSDSGDGIPRPLADCLVAQVTLRMTAFMSRWNGEAGDAKLMTLLRIGQFSLKLQRAGYQAEREALARRKRDDLAELKEGTRLDMLAAWPEFREERARKEEKRKSGSGNGQESWSKEKETPDSGSLPAGWEREEGQRAVQGKAQVQTPSSAGESKPVKVDKGSHGDRGSRPESTEMTIVENVEFGRVCEGANEPVVSSR